MKLEELVDKIESLVTSDPNIDTFLFDEPEKVNELHSTDYPLLLMNPLEDTIDPRANEQDYNLELFLLDTYSKTILNLLEKSILICKYGVCS